MPSYRSAILLAFLTICLRPLKAADSFSPGEPLHLSGLKGKFDFLNIDPERRRLLAAHTGNESLDVIDLDHGRLLKSIHVGAAQDCAVDREGGRYVVSVSKPPQMAIVDAEKLEVTGTVPLDGPADLLAWHTASKRAYAGHDDGKELWIVDPAEKKITSRIELMGEAPEGLAFDDGGKRLFQAIKPTSMMNVIDVATSKVVANWPTAPATAPHGIAMIPEAKAIAVAGGNGQLVLMSQADGKIFSSGEMRKQVDQIGYDPESHRIFCASSLGKIAVFKVAEGKLVKQDDISTSPGAKSLAVDLKTHQVWIAFAKGEEAYVQAFTPAP